VYQMIQWEARLVALVGGTLGRDTSTKPQLHSSPWKLCCVGVLPFEIKWPTKVCV
jgi:hypothetical protein